MSFILELLLYVFIAYILGIAVGYYVKVSAKILLFFLGFYVLLTAALYYLGIITVNVSVEEVIEIIKNIKPRGEGISLNPKWLIIGIPFVCGFITGLKLK